MPVPRLILASRSAARQAMLKNAGLIAESIPANIDEDTLLQNGIRENKSPSEIAKNLAESKAVKIAREYPDNLVIGSDQLLVCDNKIYNKVEYIHDAREKLKALRGKTHTLFSAVCVAKAQEVVWRHVDTARLTMHDFSDEFLEGYIDSAGAALTSCAGAYAIEELGAWLFKKVEGDYFTILGLPLLPLLEFLQTRGFRP